MWRIFNGISKAFRKGLLPNLRQTGVLATEDNDKAGQVQCYSRHRKNNSKDHAPSQEEAEYGSQKWKDFWSSVNQRHTMSEAIYWSAALNVYWQLRDFYGDLKSQNDRPYSFWKFVWAMHHETAQNVLPATKNKADQAKAESFESVLDEFGKFHKSCEEASPHYYASSLLKCGKYKEAMSFLRDGVAKGIPQCHYNLALCHQFGWGTAVDLSRAEEQYRYAIKSGGHPMAMYNLANLMLNETAKRREDEAIALLERSAKAGVTQASTQLGVLFSRTGDSNILKRAVMYFQLAADAMDVNALFYLGICYENGWGVEKSTPDAANYFVKAVNGGHANANLVLGTYYEHGLGGLPRDLNAAKSLYARAAELGVEEAKSSVARLEALEKIASYYDLESKHRTLPRSPLVHNSSLPNFFVFTNQAALNHEFDCHDTIEEDGLEPTFYIACETQEQQRALTY